MSVDPPLDIKACLREADRIVDALPWRFGKTEAQRKRARGRVFALAQQVAGMLAAGWSVDELGEILAAVPDAVTSDSAAQEKRWRAALRRARRARRQAGTTVAARSGKGDR